MKPYLHESMGAGRFPLGRLITAAFTLALASGCSTFSSSKSHSGKNAAFVPANHAGDASLPPHLRRVVLLPVAGGSVAPAESVAALDPVIAAALQRQNRFEVVALTREDCRRYFQLEELSSVSALPARFMTLIRRDFAADGVIFVDVTAFQPYAPLVLGLRAKLATVDDVRLVWTFDNVFSADDPAVSASARRQLRDGESENSPAAESPVVLQSPTRFATYAAAVMFATLPPVHAAAPHPGHPEAAKSP